MTWGSRRTLSSDLDLDQLGFLERTQFCLVASQQAVAVVISVSNIGGLWRGQRGLDLNLEPAFYWSRSQGNTAG